MNYYSHHIGDYRRDTTHLSMLEHGAYRQLLDMYYLNEMPIPKETQVVIRRLSARTQDEVNAIEIVLKEFFLDTADGWVHKRCDIEIAHYQDKADANRINGKLGGRPKKTQVVINGLSNHNPNESENNLNQEPITNNQEPITNNQEQKAVITPIVENSKIVGADKSAPKQKGQALAENWQLPKAWGDWALTDRPELTADNVRRIAENFKDHWRANANQANAKKLDWLAAWRLWVRRQRIESTGYKTTAERREANNKRAGDEFLMGSEKIIEGEFYNA